MKIAVFPVYKHMWEYALKLPPASHIFLFGLVSRIKAVPRGEPGKAAGVLPPPLPHTQSTSKSYWMASPVLFTAVYT